MIFTENYILGNVFNKCILNCKNYTKSSKVSASTADKLLNIPCATLLLTQKKWNCFLKFYLKKNTLVRWKSVFNPGMRFAGHGINALFDY